MTAALFCAALAASLLPDHLLNLVCRSGVVMDADACCPADDRDDGGRAGLSGQAVWRDEACCSLRAVDLDRAVPDLLGSPAPLVRAAALVPARVGELSPPARLVAHRPPPPPGGPPLAPRLLKSSFLL